MTKSQVPILSFEIFILHFDFHLLGLHIFIIDPNPAREGKYLQGVGSLPNVPEMDNCRVNISLGQKIERDRLVTDYLNPIDVDAGKTQIFRKPDLLSQDGSVGFAYPLPRILHILLADLRPVLPIFLVDPQNAVGIALKGGLIKQVSYRSGQAAGLALELNLSKIAKLRKGEGKDYSDYDDNYR